MKTIQFTLQERGQHLVLLFLRIKKSTPEN
jgi:hypothetical protein